MAPVSLTALAQSPYPAQVGSGLSYSAMAEDPSLRPQVLAPDTLQACQDLSSVPVKSLLCVLVCAVSFICIFCVCVCVSILVANTHLALSLAGFRERELQQPGCGTGVGTHPWTSEVSNFGSGKAGRSNPLVPKMTAFSFP